MATGREQKLRIPLDLNREDIKLDWATEATQKEIIKLLREAYKDRLSKSSSKDPEKKAKQENAQATVEETEATQKRGKIYDWVTKKYRDNIKSVIDDEEKRSAVLQRSTERFKNKIDESIYNLQGMQPTLDSATTSLLRMAGVTGTVGTVLGLLASTLTQLNRIQVESLKAGYDYNGQMIKTRAELAKIGLDFESFGQIVSEQGYTFRYLGDTGNAAAQIFTHMVKQAHDLSRNMGYFGLTTDEIATEMAEMTEQLFLQGMDREGLYQKTAQHFYMLNEEVLRYTMITGRNRRDLIRNQKAGDYEPKILAFLEQLGETGLTSFRAMQTGIQARFGDGADVVQTLFTGFFEESMTGRVSKMIPVEMRAMLNKIGVLDEFQEAAKTFRDAVKAGASPKEARRLVAPIFEKMNEEFQKMEPGAWGDLIAQLEHGANPALAESASNLLKASRHLRKYTEQVNRLLGEQEAAFTASVNQIGALGAVETIAAQKLRVETGQLVSDAAKRSVEMQNEINIAVQKLKASILKIFGLEMSDLDKIKPVEIGKKMDSVMEAADDLRAVIVSITGAFKDTHSWMTSWTSKIFGDNTANDIGNAIVLGLGAILGATLLKRMVIAGLGIAISQAWRGLKFVWRNGIPFLAGGAGRSGLGGKAMGTAAGAAAAEGTSKIPKTAANRNAAAGKEKPRIKAEAGARKADGTVRQGGPKPKRMGTGKLGWLLVPEILYALAERGIEDEEYKKIGMSLSSRILAGTAENLADGLEWLGSGAGMDYMNYQIGVLSKKKYEENKTLREKMNPFKGSTEAIRKYFLDSSKEKTAWTNDPFASELGLEPQTQQSVKKAVKTMWDGWSQISSEEWQKLISNDIPPTTHSEIRARIKRALELAGTIEQGINEYYQKYNMPMTDSLGDRQLKIESLRNQNLDREQQTDILKDTSQSNKETIEKLDEVIREIKNQSERQMRKWEELNISA